jgi:PBP1b-binding outer membrane lipoprotein LpoB
MKKIAYIALLALLIASCKKSNTDEELKAVTKTDTTVAAPKKEEEVKTEVKADTINTASKKDEDCKDIEVEMGAGRECIIKNTDLELAYQNIIKDKEVEETEYYLATIPSQNKSVTVNKKGLISIDYQITPNKVFISMFYEGGDTEVTLEKINNTIKKSIYHYAD